jgi:hypothetical protein
MFHADFPGFTLKIVEHSRYLLLHERYLLHSDKLLSAVNVASTWDYCRGHIYGTQVGYYPLFTRLRCGCAIESKGSWIRIAARPGAIEANIG